MKIVNKKILFVITALIFNLSLLNANCIGSELTQTTNINSKLSFWVNLSHDDTTSSATIEGNGLSSDNYPFTKWCVEDATLSILSTKYNSDYIKEVKISNWQSKRIKLKILIGDGEGHILEKEMFITNDDIDNSDISTTLLSQYNQETKKFKVAFQSYGAVDRVVISYSFDNSTWNTLFGQNLGTIKSSSQEHPILNSDDYPKIYFKVESINSLDDISVFSNVYTLNYTPTKPYVEKGTEIPVAPRLNPLGSEVDRDSINLFWQRVNDSKLNDNVSYYEVEVADNRAFENSEIKNAGNNAKGENIYESCSFTVTGLKDATRQYFRVRGVNTLGRGAWSNVESILIRVQDRPTLSNEPKFPLMDAVGVSKSPLFRWSSSDVDEDELEFYVRVGEAPDKLYQSSGWIATHAQGTQEISYEDFKSKVALKPNTKYYWQVQVREQGRKSEYYGGEYITSPVWSFTTQAVGSDLAITNAELISEIKPNSSATFRVTIKNIGTEVARQERVQAFYKKEGNTFQFWDGSAYMQKALASGESETLDVEVKFRDDIWKKNGITYDNVLISGDSTVIFDFKKISDQDINSANNRKEVGIHYENAGLPVFEHFWVYVQGIEKSKIRGIIGEAFQIYFGVSDDTTVSKAVVDYRLNSSDSWKTIKTITNDDDYLQGDFDWNIPNDRSFISDDVELRVRAYEANGVDYSEKIAKFPIYSNTLEIKNITFDRNSYTVGDEVIVSYDLIHDYDIHSFEVVLRNPDTGERKYIVKDKYAELGTQPTGTIQFTIPDDNEFAGENLYLDIEMYDIHYVKIMQQESFPLVKANTKLPSPFDSFIEVYKTLNTNFPSDTGGHSSYNQIEKVITDDNNVVHMLVASIASYYTNSDYKRYKNINYLYVTYDYNSKQLSSPIQVISTTKENQIFFKDFIFVDNKPFVLFQKDASQYYLSHKNGSSFTSLQEVLNKSTIKNNILDFAKYEGKLYIKWIDTENGTSSVDRRNKVKEVYPNIGAEQNLHNEYLGYNTRVNNGHLYADCGRIFSLNSNLTVNSLLFEAEDPYCSNTGEFKDFSTTHNILDFLPISSGYGYIKLIKSDLSTVLLDTENSRAEVAIYDDKIITVGYLNNKNVVSIYDNSFNKISELSFGKYTEYYDVYAQADINKNKIMAISRLENHKAYLTVADLSNDITAPNITLSNSETTIEVGKSINLVWTANDNNDELVRYEVYKVANGEESLLETISNISTKSFTYTQESNSDKFIQLKVVAYDSSGNSNYATLPLKVQKKITFNSFSVNKSEINLGDKVTFAWSSSGGDETTQFTVYKKATDETEWSELFTTMGSSKAYMVKDFVGEYNFKIVFGSSSIEADSTLTVNGELLDFKEKLFKPQNSYYKLTNSIKLEWVDTLTTSSVLYDVWLKKSGESEFTNIGSTSDKYLEYFDDINGSFEWKVSARFGDAIVESSVISVNVKKLESPKISDINFTLVGGEPTINFSFSAIDGIENYVIVKEHNGFYEEIPVTYQSTYSDRDINYDVSYDYSILAVKDGLKTEQGESRTILASLGEQYEVIIDTADNQLLESNVLTVVYHPNREIVYEKYEIWIGTDPDSMMLYDITDNRTYAFTNLKYATNYHIEIYPIDFNGNHVSAIPAKLSFTTGFDSREITTKPVITIGEVGSYSIDLNWTVVENADEYQVCRSDNGARYNCFVRTKELSYSDSMNIEPQNSYKYKIKAVNGFNYSISDASIVVTTTLSDSLRVIRDVTALTFDVIRLENSAENNITGDLNLTKVGLNGSVIVWSSTSNSINVDSGKVDRTALDSDLNVSLEAFVKYGESNDTVRFNLVIKKIDVIDTDGDGIPDSIDSDDDNDGMLDVDEVKYGFNPLDASDATQDADGDGVSNIDEINSGTNPKDKNSIPTLATKLELYLKLDGNASDSSGNANHGVEHGGIVYGVGVNGQAGYFDGIDTFIEIAHSNSLNINRSITLSAWVKLDELMGSGDTNHIINKDGNGLSYEMGIHQHENGIPNSNFTFFLGAEGLENHQNGWTDGGFEITQSQWELVTLTYNGLVVKTYENGTLIQEYNATGDIATNEGTVRIGARGVHEVASDLFKGAIDEVRIYSRALIQSEITELYNMAEIPQEFINEKNRHKYYTYDKGLSWKEAKGFCEERGLHLATVTSEEENEFMDTLLPNLSKGYYWLGGTDEEEEGVWKWVTGEPWEYENWNVGEPNNVNGGTEHYLHLFSKNGKNKWNDLPNVHNPNSLGLICEDLIENIIDIDNDGISDDKELELGLNPNSNDSDGDGYLDSEEIGDINNPRNTDGTDEIDALDTDSDNDGVLDRVEREEGTDYLDDGDKPETLGITVDKPSVKLGLGLRDKNITINISDMQGGELKVTVTNEEQAMLTTTQQWADEWLSVGDYEGKELLLTLKGLKAESGLISIEVTDRFGQTKTEDIVVEVIEIADFVESRSSEQMNLSDANATCIDMGARLPNIQELRDAYQLVDNYIDLKGIRTPIWGSTPSPSGSGYYSYITQNGIDGHWGYDDREDANKYVHCVKVKTPVIDTDLVTVKLNAGWNNVALSPMTLEELIAKVGAENLLIVQGALPQSSYRKLFVDQGRAYLNSFKKIEYGQGYWIKVNEAVEFTYSKIKYSGTQEIVLKAGWNNVSSLYGLTLEEIIEQLGADNVLIIQGALPQSSYRKLFVDQGRAYLNSFKKFEPNQGYWIKLENLATLRFQFELTDIAKSNTNNDLIRTEFIDAVEYTIKLFSDSQPQNEITNDTTVVYGLINGTTITMGLNSSYPTNAKFQIAVFHSNGDEVGRSEIFDYADVSIDFGSVELLN